MHWKDTIVKSSQIKWKPCKPKSTDDGKLDVDIHIPLTAIIAGQARISFYRGLVTMQEFMSDRIFNKKQISLDDFATLYNDCGYPDFSKGIKSMISKTEEPENTKKES